MGKHYLVNDSLFYAPNPYVAKNPFLTMEALAAQQGGNARRSHSRNASERGGAYYYDTWRNGLSSVEGEVHRRVLVPSG